MLYLVITLLALIAAVLMIALHTARDELAEAYAQVEEDALYIRELRANLEDLKGRLAGRTKSRQAGIIDRARAR